MQSAIPPMQPWDYACPVYRRYLHALTVTEGKYKSRGCAVRFKCCAAPAQTADKVHLVISRGIFKDKYALADLWPEILYKKVNRDLEGILNEKCTYCFK